MNILFLTNHLNIGGITTYVQSLALGLKKRGHIIHVASSGGDAAGRIQEEGIRFVAIPIKTKSEISPKVLISLSLLLPYIKKNNIDILHANTRVTQVLSFYAASILQKPFISTCHGFFKKRFFRLVFPCWGKRVIAISQQVSAHLVDDFKVDESCIRMIHNGIDLQNFNPVNPQEIEIKKAALGLRGRSVIGIIGRLSEVKGHAYLIAAMQDIVPSFPASRLLIVGEGKLEQDLINLVKRLGIEKNVVFMPSTVNTREFLSLMDVFVMPSLKEGLGLSLMEAMAQGLAVIGTKVGGIQTLIQHEYNGLLVEPKDTKALALSIKTLLLDPQKRQLLGARARDYIAKEFDIEKTTIITERVYEECIKPKK